MNHLERRFNREIILKHFQKCMSAIVTTIFICILKQETFYANFKNQSKTQKVNYKKKITVDFIIDTCTCNMVMFFSLEFSTFFTHIRVHIVVLFTQNLHFKNVQLCSIIFPFFFTTCNQNYSLMFFDNRQRHQQRRTSK